MSFKKNKKKILSILENHKQFITQQKISSIPSNYAALQHAAIAMELENEITTLLEVFSNDDLSKESLQIAFRELCKKRDLINHDTCLSFTALPEGVCNQLYFELAKLLFEPKQFDEVVSLLIPSMNACLAVEFSDFLSPVSPVRPRQLDRVQMKLNHKPLSTLAVYLPDLSNLTQAVTGDNVIFMLDAVKQYPLSIHHKLYKLLEAYPAVRKKLYQHNNDFKQLFFDIQVLEKNGSTPSEILTHFVHELTRSGSRYTGSVYASSSVEQACLQVRFYLDQLPQEFREKILALQPADKNDSLQKVLEHLEKGECVEQAASRINSIQQNKCNETILKQRPFLTEEQFKNVKKRYRHPLNITGYEAGKVIPDSLRKILLENIKITSASDYIDLFINLPPSEYFHFLTHANIMCYPALPQDLHAVLDMLDDEQQTAFLNTLIPLRKKFGGMHEVLSFCITNKITSVFEEALNSISFEKLSKLMKKKNASGMVLFYSVLQSENAMLFQSLWGKLTEQARINILSEKDSNNVTPLHHAALSNDADIFHKFKQCSEELTLSAITDKDKENKTFLHYLARNHESNVFGIIWNALPEDKLLPQITMKDCNDDTPLHFAAFNPNRPVFEKMWNSLDSEKKAAAIKAQNNEGNTLLHEAARNTNPEIFFIIWNDLSEEDRSIILKKENVKLDSPLHFLVSNSNPDAFLTIWNGLDDKYKSMASGMKNAEGFTIWHTAVSAYSLGFENVWKTLSPQDQFTIAREKTLQGKNLLYVSLENKNTGAFSFILKSLSGKDILKLINENNVYGSTVLYKVIQHKHIDILHMILAVTENHDFLFIKDDESQVPLKLSIKFDAPDIFKILWDNLSPTEQAYALQEDNMLLLHLAVQNKNPEIFFILWEAASNQDKLKCITQKTGTENNILRHAAEFAHPDVWKIIWDFFPQEDRSLEINKKDKNDNSLLHLAMKNNHITVFRTILEFIPSLERESCLKEKDAVNRTVLDCSLYKTDSQFFQIIWNGLSPEEQLSEIKDGILQSVVTHDSPAILRFIFESRRDIFAVIKQKNYEGLNLFHWAIVSWRPEMAHLIWTYLSSQERSVILKEEDNTGKTALDLSARNKFIFFTLWEYLSSQDQLTAIKKKDKNNNTLFHFSLHAKNPNIFLLCWKRLSVRDRLSVLMEKNNNGITPLQLVITELHVQIFRVIWKSLSPSEKSMLITKKNNDAGVTLLHKAVQSINDEFFFTFWECLSEQDKWNALQEKTKNGASLLEFASQQSSPQVWKMLWSLYFNDSKLISLNEQQTALRRMFHWAMEYHNQHAVQTILEHVPEKDRAALLLEQNTKGSILLEYAINKFYFFHSVWKFLPEEDQLKVSKAKMSTGTSLLFLVSRWDESDIWKTLWKAYVIDKDAILTALSEKEKDGDNIFQYLVRKGYYVWLRHVFVSLSEQDSLTIILNKDKKENNLLCFAVEENKHTTLQIILDALSPSHKFQILKEKNNCGETLLHTLAKSKKVGIVRIILNALPEHYRLVLLMEKDDLGNTPLHLAAQNRYSKIGTIFMECLPEKDCLVMLNELCLCGYTPLHRAAENPNPEILLDMLKRYPRLQRIEAIEMLETWERMNCQTFHQTKIIRKEKIRLTGMNPKDCHPSESWGPAQKVSKTGMFSQFEITEPASVTPLQASLLKGFLGFVK